MANPFDALDDPLTATSTAHGFATLGTITLVALGVAAYVLLNFAAYYFPTRHALRRAGIPRLPMKAAIEGFVGMLLAGFLLALVVSTLIP